LILEIIHVLGIIISLLTAGEALTLIVGFLVFKNPALKWANGINITLILSDLLLGGFLVQYYLGLSTNNNELKVLLIFMALIASHSFRASQTLKMSGNPYCFNRPLETINWIKLAGLLVLFFTLAQGF
jgi:hypothetical protein